MATQSDKTFATAADYVRKVRGMLKKAGGRPESLRKLEPEPGRYSRHDLVRLHVRRRTFAECTGPVPAHRVHSVRLRHQVRR